MKALAALALVCAAFLGACDSAPKTESFQLTDVTGAPFARDFQLLDPTGKTRSLSDFKGKVVVVFFGFTHCPDACPTTLGELARVMKELGPEAERLQVLFVTVDPERDTPELLAKYVPAFHPSFLGLYGDAQATARTAKEFKVIYQKQNLPGGSYSMDHSAGSFIFDPAGRLRLFAQYGQSAQALLHDIRLLLKGA
jgi:protein SCO1